MLSSLLQWWLPGKEERRTRDGRKAHECQRCQLKIRYGPDKAGTFIYCPRCRASVRLPGKARTNWNPDDSFERRLTKA